jgi:hypothetical protein
MAHARAYPNTLLTLPNQPIKQAALPKKVFERGCVVVSATTFDPPPREFAPTSQQHLSRRENSELERASHTPHAHVPPPTNTQQEQPW